jgi:hypothetical protein
MNQMNPTHILPPYSFKIHFNIILPQTVRLPNWSPLLRPPSYISLVCPVLSQSPLLADPNHIHRIVQIMRLLTAHFIRPLPINLYLLNSTIPLPKARALHCLLLREGTTDPPT